MPLRMFDYGNVVNTGENVLNARYNRDPNNPRNALLRAKVFEATNPQSQAVEYGKVNPGQFTPESLAKYDKTRNFADLVHHQNFKNVTIGGVDGIMDLVTRQFYPMSTLQAEVDANRQLAGGTAQGRADVDLAMNPLIEYNKVMAGQHAQAGQPYAPIQSTELNLGVQQPTTPPVEVGAELAPSVAPPTAASLAADKAAATSKAKFEQERQNVKPKMIGAADAAQKRTESLKELVTLAKKQANAFTTGFLGATTKAVPGTPAHDLSQTLLTLQANAGFDRLQEMRNNSVTGGALGQVSERELGLLMAAYAALEQSQSKGQFIQNLDRFEKQVDQSWKRVKLAYRLDYGEDYKELEVEDNETKGGPSDDFSTMTDEQLRRILEE